jgi:hypothetical protein
MNNTDSGHQQEEMETPQLSGNEKDIHKPSQAKATKKKAKKSPTPKSKKQEDSPDRELILEESTVLKTKTRKKPKKNKKVNRSDPSGSVGPSATESNKTKGGRSSDPSGSVVSSDILSAIEFDEIEIGRSNGDISPQQESDFPSSTVRYQKRMRQNMSGAKYDGFDGDVSVIGTTFSSFASDTIVVTEESSKRPRKYDSAIFTGVYVVMVLYILIARWVVPAIRVSLDDGYWMRCIWFTFLPVVFGMMLFPAKVVVFSVLCLFGSYRNVDENSTTHSAHKPPVPNVLPKIIVEMPVYKESFGDTIKPSLDDILVCIRYYRARGGTVEMFINDDGLQLISEEDRQERIQYYKEYDIAYVSRPPPSLLARRGMFKKASNMNFCLNFSLEVDQAEKELSLDKEAAIQHVIDSRPYPVLAGGPVGMEHVKNILLVDSDTRVPPACLYDTVGEFAICPNLGFAQHTISVLRVEDNYWEDFLANFTDLLYNLYIALGTANGDPPPLVGHNATLNWEAMQEVSWFDSVDDHRCFWSECHVSEDFDMSLRLQAADYVGRYIMYTGEGFKEGVSVTVFDEMVKLKKYAYGTSEMLFNKVKDWPRHGPLSPLIKSYLRSSVRWDAKLNMLAYLFTYIAMSWAIFYVPVSLYLSILSDSDDHMQQTSFEILCGCLLVFFFFGNATLLLLSFLRKRKNSLLLIAFEQAKFVPIVSLFFSGLLYHVFMGLVRHLFDMKAEWGATTKELDSIDHTLATFVSEVVDTVKRFWFMYILVVIFCCSLAALFLLGPEWLKWNGIAMSPFICMIFAHVFMPILLNSSAMYSLWFPLKKAFCCLACRKKSGQKDEGPVIVIEETTASQPEDDNSNSSASQAEGDIESNSQSRSQSRKRSQKGVENRRE